MTATINATPDLSIYTKDALVEIAKRIPTLHIGDYARKSKSDIRGLIEQCGADEIQTGIQACIDDDIFEEQDDDEPAPVASPAAATFSVTETKKLADPVAAPAAGKVEQSASDKLAEALAALMPAAPVDMTAVRQVVAHTVGQYSLEVDKRFDEVAGDIAEAVQAAVEQVASSIAPRVEKVYITPLGNENKVDGEAHVRLDRVVKLASIRKNTLLVGPAGCGKTYLAHQAATALGFEFGSISCTAGMSESQLLGWLLPIGDGGKFEYVESEFVRMYENGGVYLLDEVDAADANTLMILNQALANGGFYVPQARRWIKRHKDFVCIAAANTYGHGGDMVYAGREKLDGAFLDRFRSGIVSMDYDAKLEMKLVDPAVLEWGLTIRGKIISMKLRRVMSTRVMLDFSDLKAAHGWGVKDWEESYFADWTRDELTKIGK